MNDHETKIIDFLAELSAVCNKHRMRLVISPKEQVGMARIEESQEVSYEADNICGRNICSPFKHLVKCKLNKTEKSHELDGLEFPWCGKRPHLY